MKEIVKVMRELRNFPPNWFVYPEDEAGKRGLMVCDMHRQAQGFIDLDEAIEEPKEQ